MDNETQAKERKRKRRRRDNSEGAETNIDESKDISIDDCSDDALKSVHSESVSGTGDSSRETKKSRTAGHRAGFDAFMTGFVFAFFAARYGTAGDDAAFDMDEFKNRVFLSGKDFPLTVAKSNFAKYSKEHTEKFERILKTR